MLSGVGGMAYRSKAGAGMEAQSNEHEVREDVGTRKDWFAEVELPAEGGSRAGTGGMARDVCAHGIEGNMLRESAWQEAAFVVGGERRESADAGDAKAEYAAGVGGMSI